MLKKDLLAFNYLALCQINFKGLNWNFIFWFSVLSSGNQGFISKASAFGGQFKLKHLKPKRKQNNFDSYKKIVIFPHFSKLLYKLMVYLIQQSNMFAMQKREKPSKESELKDVPEFIAKLYHILDDPKYKKSITWGQDGTTVIIRNQKRLESQVLPLYFRHHKMESFIRQLNNYGFTKDTSFLRQADGLCFTNQFFQRKNLKALCLIQRRNKKQSPISRQSTSQQLGSPYMISQVTELKAHFNELSKKRPTLKPQLSKIYELMDQIINRNFRIEQRQQSSEEQEIIKAAAYQNMLQSIKDVPVPVSLLKWNSTCSFDREFAKHCDD